jgi:predicted ATPase/signal transduction histidine kinase/ActR/RegA family two-component response regulator
MIIANHQTLGRICATAGSELYRARRLTDGLVVLLKWHRPDHANAAQSARFRSEYRLLQSLNVVGAAKPLALVDERGSLAMPLEDFASESLEAVLSRDSRMDLLLCLSIARHLADALAGIDAARVIHRDIRPANILVALDTGRILLVDFSNSTPQEVKTVSPEEIMPVGDWAYVSPEQTGRMNRALDYRTDCYSMGVLLYRMLTGQLPFQANDPLEWTHCHIARMPPSPHDIAPDVPQAVSDIAMKLLAKLPEDRYQSMRGLRCDLDRCLAQWQVSGRIEPFALGAEDISERFQIPHKLYGRESEAAMLLAAFDRMAATGQAEFATISGYSGIGKSSLVDALREPIVARHGYFISGKFDQYQRDIPYATLTQALRELVPQLLSESEARIAGWRQRIQAAVGVNGQLIIDVLPQVELIIGEQAPIAALPSTEAQNRFRMVFRQFIAVFTTTEHPLVLFLDDLQWIDAASLVLIEHLLTHADTRYLLLIGAYRDNEVGAAHPLRASLETIRNARATTIEIQLAPLGVAHLNQLTADTLHATSVSCEPLTRLICERTEGNPFFFTQFLDALQREGLLQQDPQHRAWQWDLDQIRARDFADNVVDLMVGKLRQLPVRAQEALRLAACLGNSFDLRHLALVSGQVEVEQHLAAALQENLIVRSHDRGKFLHDRIQQAAYSLIPEKQRAQIHLALGRVLLASMTGDELAEKLFDIANQLNRGAAKLVDRGEKTQVATINLRAGRKAKASAAYASARVYLAAGMALLDETCWGGQYELMFSLRLECAECEFLTGELDRTEQLIAELLQRGASQVDVAAVYHQKVLLHIVKSEHPQAVDSALTCLKLFGIDIPVHPSWEQVQAEYETVWRNLQGRPIEGLIDLPLMQDPDLQAAMRVLSALSDPAYNTGRNLFCLQQCRMVNLTLEHGMSGASAHACAELGFSLGPVFQRYPEGFRLAKLGCELVEKHGFLAYRAKVQDTTGIAAFWTHPMATAIDFVRASIRTAIGTGDLTYACYGMYHIVILLLLRNDPLDAVWRESEIALDFVHKAKFRDMEDTIVPQQRFIATMQGRTATFSTFDDAQFKEAAFEAQLLAGDRSTTMICWYWITKTKARFLSGDYAEALASADKAKALLSSSTAHFPLLDYYYYTALTMAALYEHASVEERDGWRDRLAAHQAQLREWAESYPPTFGDKHALVSAEIARLEGRDADAMRRYEEAIQLARENGFVQNKAVAHELAAGFYLARGSMTAGRAHLREARSCFANWGADGKVRHLDERMAPLSEEPASPPGISLTNVAQLDLLSVAKASQAISGQIVIEDLVDTLMRIVLENAGAQTGHLILARDERLVLTAEAGVEQQTIHVQLPPDQAPPESALPASIINYVRRSQERVLLDDATLSNPFSTDDYFVRRQPKSVLCLPIMRRSALIGLLYLENNLATHAFTSERLTVLELLASQAAISLENALLYANLKRSEANLKRSEAYLSEAQRLSHTGSYAWNAASGEIFWSDEMFRIYEFDRTVKPTMELILGRIHPDDQAPLRKLVDEASPDATRRDLQYRLLMPDGTVKYLRSLGGKAGAGFRGELTFIGTVMDVTEHKRAEEALQRSEQRLRQAEKMEEIGRLAGGIAHDFNNILGLILGYGELAQNNLDEGGSARRHVDQVMQAGARGKGLVERILTFSPSGAGERVAVHVQSVVEETVELLTASLPAHVRLDTELDAGDTAVMGDATQFHQVAMNLCTNALQAMEHGGVLTVLLDRVAVPERRTFSHGTLSPGPHVRLSVRDTGSGIPLVVFERMFDPFFTTKGVGDGTGLGLSMVQGIVADFGGAIDVTTQAGVGSTFTVWLSAAGETTRLVAEPPEKPPYGNGETVMIVDDQHSLVALTEETLAALGYEPVGFDSSIAALQAFRAEPQRFDLVLTDQTMPDLSGVDLAREIHRVRPELPVVLMSGYSGAQITERARAAGVAELLRKPLVRRDIAEALGRALRRPQCSTSIGTLSS